MDPITILMHLAARHPTAFWTVVVCWFFSTAFNLLPTPKPDSHWSYVWAFNIGQWMAANQRLIRIPGLGNKPQEPPAR